MVAGSFSGSGAIEFGSEAGQTDYDSLLAGILTVLKLLALSSLVALFT